MEDDGDGERAELLRSILDLLQARGYYRARISALSAFDKLTGGLAWCITFSKVDVDFDTFYDDDATLYYKIKVGEAIEEALQRMECPHPLQAHQIQGLDYQAVLPVVRWLVKRVLATLEEFGDQAQRYAHLQYQEKYKLPSESSLQEARLDMMEATLEASVQEPVRKALSSARDNSASVSNKQPEDPAAILPRALSLTDEGNVAADGVVCGTSYTMEESEENVDTRHPDDTASNQQVDMLKERINVQRKDITRLEAEYDAKMRLAEEMKLGLAQQENQSATVQVVINELQALATAAGSESLVQKLMELMEKSKMLEEEEADFRAECRKKRAEIQARIKQLEHGEATEDDEHATEVDEAYKIDSQKYNALRKELSEKSRAVAMLQRRLDDSPSQTELLQYERRFVELYLNIQRKLRETRKYFATYNALAEAHELTEKELSLLNSIHAQFEVAMTTPGGRLNFVESMEGIAKGMQLKLSQIERRFVAEQSTYSALKNKHTAAVAEQRHYYALVKQFQDECALNEKLQSKLKLQQP